MNVQLKNLFRNKIHGFGFGGDNFPAESMSNEIFLCWCDCEHMGTISM